MQILIVDDDPAIVQLIRATLADEGYEVRSAANGSEAVEIVDSVRPDAIVLDLEMPVMNGRATFLEIRRRGITAPVVFLSAHDAHRARRELGAEDAMEKPFDPDELVTHLVRLAS